MANKKFLLGILVITLVFGLMVVACDAGGDPVLNGTWKSADGVVTYKFAAGTWELSIIGLPSPYQKGTYVASGGTLTLTMTHFNLGAGLVTVAEAEVSETTQTCTYTISGRTLTLTSQGNSTTLTKQ
jgi:hypothetical protein